MASVNKQHDALLDERLHDETDPRDMLGAHGVRRQLTKRGGERALEAARTAPLGYAPHARHGSGAGNGRPGKGKQTVQSETAPVDIDVPRDRDGRCAPPLVQKRQRRLDGFDDTVRALYARGLSTRAIHAHLEELYGGEVSSTLLAHVTDAVLDAVRAGQSRPRASVSPLRSGDALFVQSRQEGPVQTNAVSVALGRTRAGEQALWGLWLSASDGAKCWVSVWTERTTRGVADGLIACVDGLPGLPEALATVWPKPQGQRCLVPKGRHRWPSVPWTARQAVAADLRAIDAAATRLEAEQALERCAERWDTQSPTMRASWLTEWERLTVFLDYPPAMRRVIDTTNAMASLHYAWRKRLKTRGTFPNAASIVQVLSLALQHVAPRWTRPIRDWQAARNQFVILFGERVPV